MRSRKGDPCLFPVASSPKGASKGVIPRPTWPVTAVLYLRCAPLTTGSWLQLLLEKSISSYPHHHTYLRTRSCAGAVGLLVGQLCKHVHGCRVVGSAGSDEKVCVGVRTEGAVQGEMLGGESLGVTWKGGAAAY